MGSPSVSQQRKELCESVLEYSESFVRLVVRWTEAKIHGRIRCECALRLETRMDRERRATTLEEDCEKLAQQLSPSIASVGRDAALVTNEAEAYRSSQLRTIEPSSLMEPIHRRRTQLLESRGPIDMLASKSRNLAVTSSAAVAVTAAGVGSASVLGSSLGLVDASSAALALDPSTGLGLGLLTLTLVGWRMQGQYNKFRRRFREDWQRFSEGLDQDLKGNFESVLRQQITGPSSVVSSRILSLTQQWGSQVHQQEAHIRRVAAEMVQPHDPSQARRDASVHDSL